MTGLQLLLFHLQIFAAIAAALCAGVVLRNAGREVLRLRQRGGLSWGRRLHSRPSSRLAKDGGFPGSPRCIGRRSAETPGIARSVSCEIPTQRGTAVLLSVTRGGTACE